MNIKKQEDKRIYISNRLVQIQIYVKESNINSLTIQYDIDNKNGCPFKLNMFSTKQPLMHITIKILYV